MGFLFGLGFRNPIQDKLVMMNGVENLVPFISFLMVVFNVFIPDFFLLALVCDVNGSHSMTIKP